MVARLGLHMCALGVLSVLAGQVIEFESGGLRYQTLTKNGVTVMFAPLPHPVRGYSILQIAISNGSGRPWNFKPADFKYLRQDGAELPAVAAKDVVQEFMHHGGREDVIKLVTAYEGSLYGLPKIQSTNGYEVRRQSVMADATNTRLKAAAAASAIVLVPVRLKAGESTDGAVFFSTGGKPLGPGKLIVEGAGSVFTFQNGEHPAP
ncbi:MAG: hypothetical protein U0Q16_07640 [Bryobacteraceae bacterium]